MHGWHAMFQSSSSKVWPDTRSDLTAITLECINVIIPFDVIRQKYPGGLVQCLMDRRGSIAGKWAYLVRRVSVSGWGNGQLGALAHSFPMGGGWAQAYGGTQGDDGLAGLLHSVVGGRSAPCDWLEYSEKNGTVWLKGTEPSMVMYGPNCTEAYMERIIRQEEERPRAPRPRPVRGCCASCPSMSD